ncbi:MAG: hypothetical protein LBV00_08610, partial [Propionibacteriaceae bacterium]|nr:hypothetical protein [Propionibacteriaceae bacterium]
MITELSGPLAGVDIDLSGAHMRVLDQGAQVVAWTPAHEEPVLFASALATQEPGRHVRAGAPVVFPWFGFGPDGTKSPVHGYARLRPFERQSIEESDGQVLVRHLLTPSQTDDIPASLLVTTQMRVDSIEIALTVTNLADVALTYEIGLHTYFTVGDVEQVTVRGLEGRAYLDRVTGQRAEASNLPLVIDGEIYRAY